MNNNKDGYDLVKDEELYRAEESIKFLQELAIEYQNMEEELLNQKKAVMVQLSEWEEKLSLARQYYADKLNLFSPNNKSYDLEEINSGILREQERLEQISSELGKMQEMEMQLCSASTLMEKCFRYQNDLGLTILERQEKDRQRIARDLHDSTVQNLTSLVHKIELCSRLVEMDPPRAKLELSVLENNVKMVINEMREIIYNLKPMSLDDLGLSVTIERYAKQLMTSHDIKVYVKHNPEIENILPVVKLSLFRVVQEACHNVIKHARAKRIDINVLYDINYITVSIKDDGIGFDSHKQMDMLPERNSGYGLSIMKERVYLLSGTMKIHSEISKGTSITIRVPFTKGKGERNEQTD